MGTQTRKEQEDSAGSLKTQMTPRGNPWGHVGFRGHQ